MNYEKCVMIIDEQLPLGIIANTAAIMGITLGKSIPEVVGKDVYDKTGNKHLGIITFPVPILKGDIQTIKTIRKKLYEPEFSDLIVIDFSDIAQMSKIYNKNAIYYGNRIKLYRNYIMWNKKENQ